MTANVSANKPAKSLSTLAMDEAVTAAKGADSAVWKATVAIGLVMVNSQLEAMDNDKPIDEAKNKATFRAFLKQLAFKGVMVWRDSQFLIDRIQAEPTKDEKRRKAASDYIDGGKNANDLFAKPDGARLVDGLARLRTYSVKLMAGVLKNHADIIREMHGLKAAGADAEGIKARFERFVRETYGATWSDLSSALTDAKPAKDKPDPIDAIEAKAKDMTDTDLLELIRRLETIRNERMSNAAAFEEPAESEEEPEEMRDAA